MSNIHVVLVDLQVLAKSTREDYEQKRWESYRDYIREFNRLQSEVKKCGIAVDIEEVADVPSNQQAWMGVGSDAEKAKLRELVNKTDRLLARVSQQAADSSTDGYPEDSIRNIEKLCTRFHLVVRQLRKRYADRDTLDVADEYDVQDLMHAMLRIFFDDIRPEEYTPSYAGKSSRMDFLIKGESIALEVKKARKDLRDKDIGSQLIDDIARYREHPSCKTLICFVYDPDEWIVNPSGLENDLSKVERGLIVKVLVVPKGY